MAYQSGFKTNYGTPLSAPIPIEAVVTFPLAHKPAVTSIQPVTPPGTPPAGGHAHTIVKVHAQLYQPLARHLITGEIRTGDHVTITTLTQPVHTLAGETWLLRITGDHGRTIVVTLALLHL